MDNDMILDLSSGWVDGSWLEAERRLLAAVAPELRARVQKLLAAPRLGGRGLRAWVGALAADPRYLPRSIPSELVEVYLADPEAVPLHDCGDCGLAVPVRPGWGRGQEAPPDRVYFAACPNCGGRTGPYAFWSQGRCATVTC